MKIANDLSALAAERVNYMLENYSPSASYQNAENELIKIMAIVEEKCGAKVATAIDNLNIDILDEFLDAAYKQGVADAFQLNVKVETGECKYE